MFFNSPDAADGAAVLPDGVVEEVDLRPDHVVLRSAQSRLSHPAIRLPRVLASLSLLPVSYRLYLILPGVLASLSLLPVSYRSYLILPGVLASLLLLPVGYRSYLILPGVLASLSLLPASYVQYSH